MLNMVEGSDIANRAHLHRDTVIRVSYPIAVFVDANYPKHNLPSRSLLHGRG